MPKKARDYSRKKFVSSTAAYNAYQKRRLMETTNPALAPRGKFAQIWGWERKKVARPGK